jgi:hypothetical protein
MKRLHFYNEFYKINIKGKNMRKDKKEIYESPQIEVIEFELEDSIAASGDFGSGTFCGGEEGVW